MLTERTEGIGSRGEFLEREDARRGWLGRRAAEVTRVARTLAARGERPGGRWKVRKVKPRAEAAPRKGNEGDAFVDELLDRGNPTRIRFSREPFRESAAGVCCQGSNLESRVHFFRPRFLSLSPVYRSAPVGQESNSQPSGKMFFLDPGS